MTTPIKKQGLYDPNHEHENCGIGLIVDMKGRKSHDIVSGALEICVNLDHRGGCGCDPITGDGAGIFLQLPHKFSLRQFSKNIKSNFQTRVTMVLVSFSCQMMRVNMLQKYKLSILFSKN